MQKDKPVFVKSYLMHAVWPVRTNKQTNKKGFMQASHQFYEGTSALLGSVLPKF